VGIPDAILHKKGASTVDEQAVIRMHPIYAYELLYPGPYLRPALAIPYFHHEKWDGSGYPLGLHGNQIPFAARLFAIVDIWDALLSDRPYQAAWSRDKTIAYIRDQSGKHFDPEVVRMFGEFQTSNYSEHKSKFTHTRCIASSGSKFPRSVWRSQQPS
jgi:HD-GYP domain-containing protein (c-di-GMP phosphodiesterase class II)